MVGDYRVGASTRINLNIQCQFTMVAPLINRSPFRSPLTILLSCPRSPFTRRENKTFLGTTLLRLDTLWALT
jgi:hypothetical protein